MTAAVAGLSLELLPHQRVLPPARSREAHALIESITRQIAEHRDKFEAIDVVLAHLEGVHPFERDQ